MDLIEFECQGYQFALPLTSVRRVIATVQPTPLPGAPEIVMGVLNVSGELAVAVNFFARAGLAVPALATSQQMLLVDSAGMCMALVVDQVSGVVHREDYVASSVSDQFAGADFVDGFCLFEDGLCMICDLEKFLNADEKMLIVQAMEQIPHVTH